MQRFLLITTMKKISYLYFLQTEIRPNVIMLMGRDYKHEKWCLFINASNISLTGVLLHARNTTSVSQCLSRYSDERNMRTQNCS
jgi:hypothetical protein